MLDSINLLKECPPIIKAYIDPGTGSMLFTILIGIFTAVIYWLKGVIIKIKYFDRSRKNDESDVIPFVIYSEGKRYWNSFELICEEFEKREINVTFLTSSQNDPVFDKNYQYVKPEYIGEGNKAFTKLNYLKADVLLATTPSLDVYQWKRSKDVKWYVHIYHSANDAVRYRMFGIDYYDAIICAGEYYIDQIRELERKRKLPNKELLVYGVPYLDLLKKRFDENKIKKKNNKTVLLASTWGPSSLLNRYKNRIIDILIDSGYSIIIRPHPQSYISEKSLIEELQKQYPNNDKLIWDNDQDNFNSLCNADILVSDFSGIIFDFVLVFDKPIIYTDVQYDSSIYDSYWLDNQLWTFRVLPKIGAQLTEENLYSIKNIIGNLVKDKEQEKAREQARKETWSNQGKCAKLTVDYIIEKQKKIKGGIK